MGRTQVAAVEAKKAYFGLFGLLSFD